MAQSKQSGFTAYHAWAPLKRQELNWSISDRGWKEVLQQCTVWEKSCDFWTLNHVNLNRLEFSLVSYIRSWFISKQYQSFAVCTTSPLPALSSNTIPQHLLAWGIIVETNTNHVPFTALPASQPLMMFPVTSRNMHIQRRSEEETQIAQQKPAQPVKQVQKERVGESWRTPWRCEEWPINHSLSPSTVNEVTTLK